MRRLVKRLPLKQGIAWTLSTAVAGALSWWGVHTVMAATAYPPPVAVALTEERVEAESRATPAPSASDRPNTPVGSADPAATGTEEGPGYEATGRPDPGPGAESGAEASAGTGASPTPGRGGASPSGGPSGGAGAEGTAAGGGSGSAEGEVKSYTVDGGRVAFSLGRDSAELVSATPNAGWRMQVWHHPQWIRVTFTQGERGIDVFCSWHEHPPLVQIEGQ
ncbi:hypothetical protein [Streptomyces bacillaris]|uniref:hypothetical protein n=1 Tax=Streptomyces bacillaris TaxID=68179 RepID=UPI003D72B707